jgi:hypothetical protein
LQAAARLVAALAATIGAPAPFCLRRWRLVGATAATVSALAGLELLTPLHRPAPIALVARTPVVPAPPPAAPAPAPAVAVPAQLVAAPMERAQARVVPARVAQSRARRRPGQPPEARAESLTAQALATLDAAESRFQWRDLTGAERLTREALRDLPGEPRAHYFLGLVLLAMDRAGEAAAAFRHTIDLDPGFADATTKLQIAEERATTTTATETETEP